MKKLSFLILLFFCSFGSDGTAQSRVSKEYKGDARLPKYFTGFSKNDVFAAVFPDFDKTTGRVAHVLNEQDQPSLVRIDLAQTWIVGGHDYLVVMIQIAGYDEQFGEVGLCGNCSAASPIAILQADGDRLELVAKQDDDFHHGDSSDYDAFWYSGHDFDVAFDLGPYRLNDKEMLIGVRYQHMWIPANSFSTTLLLYRIEGRRLRNVFEDLVIDRDWHNGPGRLKMEKTTSVLSSVAAGGRFNQLVEIRKTRRGIADPDTYDFVDGTLINTSRDVWRFNGTRFVNNRDDD